MRTSGKSATGRHLELGLKGLAIVGLAALAGCTDADVASRNLSKAADMFEIERRVVFYNGITDSYMLTIEGRCSLGNSDGPGELTVTCKTGPDAYKKHFLGLSDNVTYFVEQLDGAAVSTYHYRVVFKPQTILPDIDFRGDAGWRKKTDTYDLPTIAKADRQFDRAIGIGRSTAPPMPGSRASRIKHKLDGTWEWRT